MDGLAAEDGGTGVGTEMGAGASRRALEGNEDPAAEAAPSRARIASPRGGACRAMLRGLALALTALAACLTLSVPAQAISQRGHSFAFSFGSFTHPAGVAVSAASGDVYVSDPGHKRVEQFQPVIEHEQLVGESFLAEVSIASPGAIAVDNSTEGEDPSSGDVYVVTGTHIVDKLSPTGELIGTIKGYQEKAKEKKFKAISQLAVDASGNLFVYETGTPDHVYEFNDEAPNTPVTEYATEETGVTGPAFAVDSNDGVYVNAETRLVTSVAQAKLLVEVEQELKEGREAAEETSGPAFIAKLGSLGKTTLIPALDDEPSSAVAVNPRDVSQNLVDELNDVYVLNVAGFGADKTTTVAQFGPEEGENGEGAQHETGTLIQRFGATGLTEGDAIAVDPLTGTVFVADAAVGNVDVFTLEQPGKPTVEASAESSPTLAFSDMLDAKVDPDGSATTYYFEYGSAPCGSSPCAKTPAVPVGSGFSDVSESISLSSLAPGEYHYRVLAENEHGSAESAERTFTVLAQQGLLPDGRAWEMVSPPDKAGAEPEAIRKEGGLIEAAANGDAIAYAADGPMPVSVEPTGNHSPEPSQIISVRDTEAGHEGWRSEDITTPSETAPGPFVGYRWEYQAFSPNLALSLVNPFPAIQGSFARPPLSPLLPGEERGKQENTPYLRDDAPLAPESSEETDYAKAKQNGEEMHNAGFFPLVTKANEPGEKFGRTVQSEGIDPEGTTPDLSHVVYRSVNVNQGLYEWSNGNRELISVLEHGEPAPTGYLGSGIEAGAVGGGEPANTRHAISNNGSRVFWTYVEKVAQREYAHLEVHESGETAAPQTLQLDQLHGVSETEGDPPDAVFQTASTDGSKVFFTDGQRLTPDSGATSERPDLYVAEVAISGGHLVERSLNDLTALRDEGGDVLLYLESAPNVVGGGVIGASENGDYVYFVANGALAPGATHGHCNTRQKSSTTEPRPLGVTCNLYVRHYDEASESWEPAKLIAALSPQDSPDWGDSGLAGDLAYMTAGVAPEGDYLAFMSDRSLTGYDNEDVSSKAPGERLDEEVYLYHAAAHGKPEEESLVCVSCSPNGARPTGVWNPGTSLGGRGEGLGLVVDRPEIWSVNEDGHGEGIRDAWLGGSIPGWTTLGHQDAPYQSRYLSSKGRLFFDSADALVPLKVPFRKETVEGVEQNVGVENVYEYEPNGVGSCNQPGGCVGLISSGESEHESAFLDASESGNDVFFLTAQPLVSSDIDANFDIYDAHVCEAASPCIEPPPPPHKACEASEQCQGSQASYEVGEPPPPSGTSIFSGPGNLVLPKHEVLPEKTGVKPTSKPLTRAQKLAKALKACRSKYKKSKSRRVSCEKRAHEKYGPKHKKKTSAKKGASKSSVASGAGGGR